MDNKYSSLKTILIALGAALVILLSVTIVVPETHQAVIIRAGNPDRTVNKYRPNVEFGQTGAGVVARIPFYESVQMIDRRVLDLDMERQMVLSNDQQRLQVDAYARFRVIDPVKLVLTAGTTDNVRTQISPILTSAVRQELGRRPFAALLTAERGTAMVNIRKKLDAQARNYGVQVIDVRIKRADLPEGLPLEAAFTRMRTDREEQAETIRANGRKDAQIIRAEADADAARIYATSYGKDPGFYDFYRAMQSYRTTFQNSDAESSIILSPDNEYLRQFKGR